MNLFDGMDSHAIQSVLVAAVIFTVASGVALVGLIGFGVRAGLVVPKATSGLPPARDAELLAWLGTGLCGLISDFGMAFLGLGENLLDQPTFFPLTIGPIVPGVVLLAIALRLAAQAIRRSQAPAARP